MGARNDVSHNTPLDLFNLSHNSNGGRCSEEIGLQCERIKSSPMFAIQLDESTDVASISQLMVFARYVHRETIEEEFLFCSPLTETTTAADVMNLVSNFFSKEHLDWGKLIGVCTDGAPAMLGCRAGFAQLVEGFHQCLAYLVEIFGSINEVNTRMQGRDRNVLNVTDSIDAIKDKLKLWVERLATRNVRVSFPVLHSLVDKKAPSASLLTDIKHHLNSLIAEFERYFPKLDPRTEQLMSLTRDPFRRNVHEILERLHEELLELTNNSALKDDFKELSIGHFWVQAQRLYPNINLAAFKMLIPFASTPLCESAFLAMLTIKSKSRNRLEVEADLRRALSTKTPNIKILLLASTDDVLDGLRCIFAQSASRTVSSVIDFCLELPCWEHLLLGCHD
ncbi:zinc finger BED domain-containing protein 5-like [Watersipora subatra]|uniref:zinc finger BED domain-containing protein 5-like n=1 Tax=Watersipora subatra TaxID=2589382 RepID=UPI00355B5DE3